MSSLQNSSFFVFRLHKTFGNDGTNWFLFVDVINSSLFALFLHFEEGAATRARRNSLAVLLCVEKPNDATKTGRERGDCSRNQFRYRRRFPQRWN
jgi:hypothetical protein